MATERIEIEIELDDGKIRKGFATIEKKGKKTAKKVEKAFDGVGEKLNSIGRDFAAGLSAAAVVSFVKISIDAFRQFEKELVAVGKTTNLAGQELIDLGQEIERLSERIPLTQVELLKLATAAGQLGVEGSANILKFTETMARLESATNVVGDEGARNFARLINVTGGSIKDIDRLGSSLVALGNNFATTENEILNTATEIGKTGSAFGVSAEQALALATAMSAVGVEAAVAGSSTFTVFKEMTEAIAINGKQLQEFAKISGQTTDDFKKAFAEDATDAFATFIEGLAKLSKTDAVLKLKELELGDKRVTKSLLPLINKTDKLRKAISLSSDEFAKNTALLTESERAFATMDSDIKELGNVSRTFAKEIGQFLAPAFSNLIILLKQTAKFWGNFFNLLNDTTTSAKIATQVESIASIKDEIVRLNKELKNVELARGGLGGLFINADEENERIRASIKEKENLLLAEQAILDDLQRKKEEEKDPTKKKDDDTVVEKEKITGLIGDVESFNGLVKESFVNTFGFLNDEGQIAADKLVALSKRASASIAKIGRAFAVGFAKSFSAVGAALVKGENALQAFGNAMLGILGDIAIQAGTELILLGLGFGSPQQVATGAALVTLGGALKAIAAQSGDSGSAVAGGAANISGPETFQEEDLDEELQKQTAVTVNVEGAVLDPVGTGQQIVQILQETFDTTGTEVITNVG